MYPYMLTDEAYALSALFVNLYHLVRGDKLIVLVNLKQQKRLYWIRNELLPLFDWDGDIKGIYPVCPDGKNKEFEMMIKVRGIFTYGLSRNFDKMASTLFKTFDPLKNEQQLVLKKLVELLSSDRIKGIQDDYLPSILH